MALTSSSTLADALGQYNDNLLWDESATKAQNALEAIRWLLANRAQNMESTEHKQEYASMSAEKTRIESYLQTQNTTRTSFVRAKARW